MSGFPGKRLPARVISVKELTNYLKGVLEQDRWLSNLWIKGEITNFKNHQVSGHLYFTLKDETSCIRCVMFRSKSSQLSFRPENGMEVIAQGYISLYERDGLYQLYVQELYPGGVGAYYTGLEQLKQKLAAEGLFDYARKKRLPLLPRKLGIVTSPTGAALRDLINVLHRRLPRLEIIVAPAQVQGEKAPQQIGQAIADLSALPGIDLIIVGRGGGSLEELGAFNTEEVARAIAASPVPIISAVGHETDYTIADLVADLRAPTPSAAAELAVPVGRDLELRIESLKYRLLQSMGNRIDRCRQRIELLSRRPVLARPGQHLQAPRQDLDQRQRRLLQSMERLLWQKDTGLKNLCTQMDSLNPLKVLGRGYSLCRKQDNGEVIRTYQQVITGDLLEVVLQEGRLLCRVEERRGLDGEAWT